MALFTMQTTTMSLPPPAMRSIKWGQVTTGASAILALILIGSAVAQSQSVQWSEIPRYLVHPSILRGVLLTLELTAGAMVFGTGLGCLLAVMATSTNIVLKAIAAGFVWWFRGVPLIVQIFLWFNIALFIPQVGVGHYSISINDLVTPALAGFLALGLHEAANMSEIIRSGLLAIDRGQLEAATALGLKPRQTFRTVILPQAARLILPPTGNQAIGMMKASAIVSVIHDSGVDRPALSRKEPSAQIPQRQGQDRWRQTRLRIERTTKGPARAARPIRDITRSTT